MTESDIKIERIRGEIRWREERETEYVRLMMAIHSEKTFNNDKKMSEWLQGKIDRNERKIVELEVELGELV